MLDKMSEPQRMILQAAVARKDRILQPPANARGAAAKAFISKLIEAGWVKEVKAAKGAPVWGATRRAA
jgi:chromosome segregation and condensation protein ScpB